MHKKSLLFDVHQDGASPDGESLVPLVHIRRQQCCALIKFEPAPEWLVLYRKIEFDK